MTDSQDEHQLKMDQKKLLEKLVEIHDKINKEIQKIRKNLEKKGGRKSIVSREIADKVINKVKKEGRLTKSEVASISGVPTNKCLDLMKSLDREDIHYIPGSGDEESELIYTESRIPKKAADLLNILDRGSMMRREEVKRKLDLSNDEVNTVVKLANKLSGGKVKWSNKKVKRMK